MPNRSGKRKENQDKDEWSEGPIERKLIIDPLAPHCKAQRKEFTRIFLGSW